MSSSLLQVREVFSESLFLYSPDSVSIMDGTDEGTVSVVFFALHICSYIQLDCPININAIIYTISQHAVVC